MFSGLKDRIIRKSSFASILFLLFVKIIAQNGEPFIQNHLPKTYEAAANNFGITQNDAGLIFVANDNAVLIFDGLNWERCFTNNQATIMSIATTPAGKIVVGTKNGDIGIVERNAVGTFLYHTLLEDVAESKKPREIIRQILTLGKQTYFLSADKLIEYDNVKLKFYDPIETFHARAFVMGRDLFVCEAGRHISVLQNDKLVPVEKTEELAKEKYFFCYPQNDSTYILGFRNIGTYKVHYNSTDPTKSRFEKEKSQCDPELNAALINNGCLLRNGNYIVTTNLNGAFEINKELKIVYHFNSRNGIYDDNVKSAFEDRNGNLWLSLYYGISFVEINSNLYRYSRNNGIRGVVQTATYFKDLLFIGTDKGIQVYNTKLEKFDAFQEFNKQVWFLYPHQNKLFVGTDNGLFLYDGKKIKQVTSNRTFCLLSDPSQPNMLYAGTSSGLEIFWTSGNEIRSVTNYNLGREIKSLASDLDNNIYFASTSQDIFYLNSQKSFDLDSIRDKRVLPTEYFENYVFSYKGKIKLGAYDGIYALEKNKNGERRFTQDAEWMTVTKNSQVFRASQFGENIICYQKYTIQKENRTEEKITLLNRDANDGRIRSIKLNHMGDLKPNMISYDSLANAIYISSNEGLYILRNNKKQEQKVFSFFLHKLSSKTDVLLENVLAEKTIQTSDLRIPYANNDLFVMLGFTSYETSNVEFCYLLEGRDRSYTKWIRENRITMSNLREGDYVLKVKARTELEDKEYVLELPFKILPSWYRTVYAYVFYLLLFIGFVYSMVKFNNRRLIAQNKKLEKTIEDRTRTISQQKEEIEHKQLEILDSINYAQRIQRSLLASDKLLKENLPEYFVFFQPKDVVSGDFYWASVLPNKQFVLVTADSTGHGVPGAIMSVLNMSCLKEAVEAEKLVDPDQILNHTRKKVIATLANDGSEEGGKDGMDCSLICFNLKNNKISVALANNPIWIVRHDSQNSSTSTDNSLDLLELKPDKMPVGKHDRDSVPFNKQDFGLQKGDMIYTLTDGFPDQFGGPKGKKFMYKQLKEVVVSISQLSLEQQKSELQKTLHEWKGTAEQVDDICVIGVRV